MANELVLHIGKPLLIPRALRWELEEALCCGPFSEIAVRFSEVLKRHGASKEQIDVLLRVPVCDLTAALLGNPRPLKSYQPLTMGAKL
jgi:hypothetical protein